MNDSGPRRITRRQLAVRGAAGVAVLAGVQYGRFAFGDQFEDHVAGVLGTSTAVATQLTRAARKRLGGREYDKLAAAFLATTSFPGDLVSPGSARDKASRRFLGSMIAESRENLMYVGMQEATGSAACTGLVRR